MNQRVQITETVLRDANQSLIATRMKLADFLPILETLDQAGYYSLECWGGATFDSCLRYLDEDPWERLRTIRAHVKNTRLQMLLRGQNLLGYKHYHDDVVEKFVELSIKTASTSSASSTRSTTSAISRPPWRPPRSTPPPTPWLPAASPTPRAPYIRWRNMSRCAKSSRAWALTPSASRIWRAP